MSRCPILSAKAAERMGRHRQTHHGDTHPTEPTAGSSGTPRTEARRKQGQLGVTESPIFSRASGKDGTPGLGPICNSRAWPPQGGAGLQACGEAHMNLSASATEVLFNFSSLRSYPAPQRLKPIALTRQTAGLKACSTLSGESASGFEEA